MPQFGYVAPSEGLPGQVAGDFSAESALYPGQAQVSTVSVGAAPGDGTYTVRIEGPGFNKDGDNFSDYSFVAAGSTQAQIVAGLRNAMLADDSIGGLVTPEDASPDLVLNFAELGQAYAISFPSNPGGKLTLALTTDPDKANLPVGIGVVKLEDGTCRQPQAGDTAIDIRGIVVRSEANIAPTPDNPEYEPQREVTLLTEGPIWVDVENAAAYGAQAFCRIVATGNEVAGAFRSDADGGDAVAINAVFDKATSGKGRSKLRVLSLPTL